MKEIQYAGGKCLTYVTYMNFAILFLFHAGIISLAVFAVEDYPFDSCHGFNMSGWTFPQGDIILKEGDDLELFCHLNLTHDEGKNLNSSSLLFFRGNRRLNDSYITIVNSTTARLFIPNMTLSSEMYYCRINDTYDYDFDDANFYEEQLEGDVNDEEDIEKGIIIPNNTEHGGSNSLSKLKESTRKKETFRIVCLNFIAVGCKPQEVQNFTCVSLNWESLVCTWKPPENHVRTVYKLSYITPGRAGRRYLCPEDMDEKSNKCNWTIFSNPAYRHAFEFLQFNMTGENMFGNITTIYKFHNYAHLIPNAPQKLLVLSKTTSSVYFQFKIGDLSVFEKGFLYKVEYTSTYSLSAWQSVYFSQKQVEKEQDMIRLNVTNLEYPNMAYDFRIYMRSAVASGNDTWSQPATAIVNTKACAPYNAPKTDIGSFEIVQLYPNAREVYLYWQRISIMEQNGDNFHYEVEAIDDMKKDKIQPVELKSSYAKFSHLSLAGHKFFVTSVNNEGRSPNSAQLYLPASDDVVEEPSEFRKRDLGYGRYELSWKPPPVSKRYINNYSLFWCETLRDRPCDGNLNWIHLGANETSQNLTLSTDKRYQFAVSANSVNTSSGMIWAFCSILHNKVGKIKNVHVSKIGSDYIEIGWKLECSDRVEGIESYRIYYCPIDMSGQDAHKCFGAEKNVTIAGNASIICGNITNLQPSTLYKFSVRVFTSDGGSGPRSDDIIYRTLDTGVSSILKALIYFLTVSFILFFILWGKRGMYHCRQMKRVEVTLPPNFTFPSFFFDEAKRLQIRENEHSVSSNKLNGEEIEIVPQRFSKEIDDKTRLNNVDVEDSSEDMIDGEDTIDIETTSSGCCTGDNSDSSSIAGITLSDSGADMESANSKYSLDSSRKEYDLKTRVPCAKNIDWNDVVVVDDSWMGSELFVEEQAKFECNLSKRLSNSAGNYVSLGNVNATSTECNNVGNNGAGVGSLNGYVSITPISDVKVTTVHGTEHIIA